MALGAGPALADAFVRIRPDDTGFRASADAQIKAALLGLDPKVRIGASTDAAKLAVTDLRAYIDKLAARVAEFRVRGDISTADQIALTRMYAQLLRLDKKVFSAKLSVLGVTTAQAQVLSLDQSLNEMDDRLKAMRAGTVAAGFAMGRFGGILGVATGRVSLFGRSTTALLGSVAVWHVLADTVIEFISVLIPATIALLAFGAAAAGPVQDVVKQMQNVQTVTEATGKALYPLTGGFQKVADAVQPQVYQMFGDMLAIVNKRTGAFITLATGAGNVLQHLATRATVAIETGGLTKFIANATDDLAKLGDIVGNIFGTIGNLLNALTAVGRVLLTTIDVVTQHIESFSASGFFQGALKGLLLLHGGFIYAGLAATALAFTASRGLGLVAKTATGIAGKIVGLGEAGGGAAIAMDRFAAGALTASQLPWGWIAVAVAGFGFLAYKILTARDATQQWLDGLQAALQQAPAVQGFIKLSFDQAQVADRLAIAQARLAQTSQKYAGTLIAARDRGGTINQQLRGQAQAVSELNAGYKKLTFQSDLYSFRVTKLALVTGSFASAEGLLAVSGLKVSDMLSTQPDAWLKILSAVLGTLAGYRAMGQTQGMLGADMNALNIMASDQVTQMTKLNGAIDGVLGIISGGQTAFVGFEQNLQATNTAAKVAGASMDGLGGNSLTLRSAWQKMFTSGGTLLDALRMMTAINPSGSNSSFPLLNRAMKDVLLQMVPLGKQSQATRAEMVAMANSIAPTVTNWQQLVKWLGNTKNPARDLNGILGKLGVNIMNVAADAKAMAANLQVQMTNAFNAAKLAATGTTDAVKKLGTAMGQTHPNMKQIQKDAQTLYDKLVNNHIMAPKVANDFVTALDPAFRKTGNAAGNSGAAHDVNIFSASMGNAQKKANQFTHGSPYRVTVIETGTGKFTIQGGIFGKTAASAGTPAIAKPRAAGGFISGGVPGRDSVPAMLMPGEVVVPTHLVKAGTLDHLRGRLPGFARGGMVGDVGVMTGQATTNFHRGFVAQFTAAMKVGMTNAMREAIAAAKAAAASSAFADTGARSGSAALAQRFAASVLPRGWSFPALLSLWNRESGWNAYAVNPSSGAYGIPQSLGHGHPYSLGDYKAQIMWGLNYIAGRYGSSQAAWAHEQAFNWYKKGGLVKYKSFDKGGWLMPGTTMAVNKTGHPEPVGKPMQVTLVLDGGKSQYGQFLANEIRRVVRTKGGGDVQVAFGSN